MFKFLKIIILFVCGCIPSFSANRPSFCVEFFPHQLGNIANLSAFYGMREARASQLNALPAGIYGGGGVYEVILGDQQGQRIIQPIIILGGL